MQPPIPHPLDQVKYALVTAHGGLSGVGQVGPTDKILSAARRVKPNPSLIWRRFPINEGHDIPGRPCGLTGENRHMLNNIGIPGLLLIAVVVLVLFGRGKVSSLMGEVGKGINAFKKGVKEETEELDNKIADDAVDVTPKKKDKV
jgi:sec-independent protein translocase protein TatA